MTPRVHQAIIIIHIQQNGIKSGAQYHHPRLKRLFVDMIHKSGHRALILAYALGKVCGRYREYLPFLKS